MTATLYQRVCQVAAGVLEVPAGELKGESSPESVETWDSLHHLNLILALEQEFGIQLDPDEIDAMQSLERIVAVVGAKLQRG